MGNTLKKAVKKNNYQLVFDFLNNSTSSKNSPFDIQDKKGNTILMLILRKNPEKDGIIWNDIMKRAIIHSKNVDIVNMYGLNIFHFIIAYNHQLIEYFIEHKPDKLNQIINDQSYLDFALENSKFEAAEIFIKNLNFIHINRKYKGKTPLERIIIIDNFELEYIIKRRLDKILFDSLIILIQSNNYIGADNMIEHINNLNFCCSFGRTIIGITILYCPKMINKILDKIEQYQFNYWNLEQYDGNTHLTLVFDAFSKKIITFDEAIQIGNRIVKNSNFTNYLSPCKNFNFNIPLFIAIKLGLDNLAQAIFFKNPEFYIDSVKYIIPSNKNILLICMKYRSFFISNYLIDSYPNYDPNLIDTNLKNLIHYSITDKILSRKILSNPKFNQFNCIVDDKNLLEWAIDSLNYDLALDIISNPKFILIDDSHTHNILNHIIKENKHNLAQIILSRKTNISTKNYVEYFSLSLNFCNNLLNDLLTLPYINENHINSLSDDNSSILHLAIIYMKFDIVIKIISNPLFNFSFYFKFKNKDNDSVESLILMISEEIYLNKISKKMAQEIKFYEFINIIYPIIRFYINPYYIIPNYPFEQFHKISKPDIYSFALSIEIPSVSVPILPLSTLASDTASAFTLPSAPASTSTSAPALTSTSALASASASASAVSEPVLISESTQLIQKGKIIPMIECQICMEYVIISEIICLPCDQRHSMCIKCVKSINPSICPFCKNPYDSIIYK